MAPHWRATGHNSSSGSLSLPIASVFYVIRLTVRSRENPPISSNKRPEFAIKVSKDAFDLFYNSPAGYRGQYFDSPDEGLRQNARLIGVIQEKLVASVHEATQGHDDDPPSDDWVRQALIASSAKVWLIEAGDPELDQIDGLTWSLNGYGDPEIINGRWELGGGLGAKAPLRSGLLIIGAWQDEDAKEALDPSKVDRARNIHEAGWT